MSNPTSVSEEQIVRFKQREGYTPVAKHLDGDRPDVITGGYGETHVFLGETHTEPEWDEILRARVQDVTNHVSSLVKVQINQHQLDTLVDFAYNVGTGKDGFGGSTLLKLLNAGDYIGADHEFIRWNKANGKVLNGLTLRRQQETEEFLK